MTPAYIEQHGAWGQNSLLVVCWAYCPAWHSVVELILSWGEFMWLRGYFLWSEHGFWLYSPKTLSDERYTEVESVHTCIPSHWLKRSWHSCPRQVNAGNKNTSSMHHRWRQNVTTSMVGLSLYAKISPKMENPRYSWECRRRRRRM